MRSLPHIGMRIVKTGISVALCLLLGYWLNQPPPVFACMAAIVVTRENLELSLTQGIARILATIVGCLFAFGIMLIDADNMYLHILLVTVGCILTIYFCILIKHPDAAALSAIIFLSLAITHPLDKYTFAFLRMVETIGGIGVALAVNAVLRPRKAQEPPAGGQGSE